MNRALIWLFLVAVFLFKGCHLGDRPTDIPAPVTGDYFGQTPPNDSALLFAPVLVSSAMNDRDFAITPDGNEIFFSRELGNFLYSTIFYVKRENGKWQTPEVFKFCTDPDYKYLEPHISYDGTKLYFISTNPYDSTNIGNEDIWFCEKVNNEWQEPTNIGAPVNSPSKEFFPSVTKDGTIYFTHYDSTANDEFIYRSRYSNGAYQQPEKLSNNVNIGRARYNAFIARDESFIIIPAYGMPDSYGGTDYYISFRNDLDNWSLPINMGLKINSSSSKEWSASLSPDGKFLFFMSARIGVNTIEELSSSSIEQFFLSPENGNSDIYWISTSVIDDLKEIAKY